MKSTSKTNVTINTGINVGTKQLKITSACLIFLSTALI